MNDPRPELKPDGVVAFAPVPLGRRRRRPDTGSVVIGLVGLFLMVAIIHPWSGNPPAVTVPKTTITPTAASIAKPAANPTTARIPTTPTEALDRVINGPGGPAGDWGVAIGAGARSGEGPAFDLNTKVSIISITVDGSWSAWAPVRPVVSHPRPGAANDPVLGLATATLCTGLPHLPSGAEVVTLTGPGATPADFQVRAWQQVGWHDEPRDVEPLPGVILERDYDGAPLAYVRQVTGGPLPDGRYEFRVVGASATTTLSVCIGRP